MLQRSTRKQNEQEQQSFNPPYLTPGSVTAVAPFATPIHAEVGNDAVRITAAGNVLGMSPAYLVVDEQGDSQWVSIEETKITDPNFLPIQQRTKRNQK